MQRLDQISATLREVFQTDFTQKGLVFRKVVVDDNQWPLMTIRVTYAESYDAIQDQFSEYIQWYVHPLSAGGQPLFFADKQMTLKRFRFGLPFERLKVQPSVFRDPNGAGPYLAFTRALKVATDEEETPNVKNYLVSFRDCGDEVYRMLPAYRQFCANSTWPAYTGTLLESIRVKTWM